MRPHADDLHGFYFSEDLVDDPVFDIYPSGICAAYHAVCSYKLNFINPEYHNIKTAQEIKELQVKLNLP